MLHDFHPNDDLCKVCELYGPFLTMECPGYVVLPIFRWRVLELTLDHYQQRWFNPHPSEPK